MRNRMTSEQFYNFKQNQWCSLFTIAVVLIPFISLQLAIASGLIGAYSLFKCAKWGLFDTE